MSEYVKSIDSNHMLAVGDEGFYNYGYNDFPEVTTSTYTTAAPAWISCN